MNLLTIIVTLLVLQANNIIVPKEAWIIILITFILKVILETIKNYIKLDKKEKTLDN